MEIRDLFELENDKTFQKLNQQVNSFNALKILRMENYEIRHSNILAWLLDPKENHRLQDYFLRKTLEHLLLIDENAENLQYDTVGTILNRSLMESHVYREVKTTNNRYIDLVIVNQELKTVFLIENKFYSTESLNQLDDYLNYIQQNFKDFTIIPIYLTLDGEAPSNPHYFIMTYERIEAILHTILMLNKNQMASTVYDFIDAYDQILREKFYPNQEQILQAIDIYRNHQSIIESLSEQLSINYHELHFDSGYHFEFMMKYKNTISYINKHGKNILSYSFKEFIHQHFNEEVLYNAHPTIPNLLPPEWEAVSEYPLRELNYWLGKGIVVWFEKTNDNRLKLTAEIGPIEYAARLSLLQKLEKLGMSFKANSKLEKARYTRFYSQKTDISKWEDMEELTQAMMDLYNDEKFIRLRKQVASVLNNENMEEENVPFQDPSSLITKKELVREAFRKWILSKNISENAYRISARHLSFKIPLFDSFKEVLGETREKWWWDNGPFLFWIEYAHNTLSFVLEVGPIEVEKRVQLMESIKQKGISFNKKGLMPGAKYSRIYTNKLVMDEINEEGIVKALDTLYHHADLQLIINKLQVINEEIILKD